MTQTKFFKFPDETTAKTVLAPSGYYTPEVVEVDEVTRQVINTIPGFYKTADLGWAMDIIGTIYEPPTYDEEGNELTPPVALPGFHINFIGPYNEGLEAYRIEPKTPQRKFL